MLLRYLFRPRVHRLSFRSWLPVLRVSLVLLVAADLDMAVAANTELHTLAPCDVRQLLTF